MAKRTCGQRDTVPQRVEGAPAEAQAPNPDPVPTPTPPAEPNQDTAPAPTIQDTAPAVLIPVVTDGLRVLDAVATDIITGGPDVPISTTGEVTGAPSDPSGFGGFVLPAAPVLPGWAQSMLAHAQRTPTRTTGRRNSAPGNPSPAQTRGGRTRTGGLSSLQIGILRVLDAHADTFLTRDEIKARSTRVLGSRLPEKGYALALGVQDAASRTQGLVYDGLADQSSATSGNGVGYRITDAGRALLRSMRL